MTKYFSQSLSCEWNLVLFCHAFPVVPESLMPLLGCDVFYKVQASVHMNVEKDVQCLSLVEVDINPEV